MILLAVIAGLYGHKKLSFRYFWFFVLLLCIVQVKACERDFLLKNVPDALNVEKVIYTKQNTWLLFSPYNDRGIHVYLLPEQIGEKISESGIHFLDNLPPNLNKWERRGRYARWYETPIPPGYRWNQNQTTGQMDIRNYISGNDRIDIKIDEVIAKQANSIVNNPGSYYAYNKDGVIVVSQNNEIILYFYNTIYGFPSYETP
ncbi:MAG: hypothetical protein KDF59_12955 [Nitrosomonas sp.]|nr:hypothetical protein [Nitrosomonas sp.]